MEVFGVWARTYIDADKNKVCVHGFIVEKEWIVNLSPALPNTNVAPPPRLRAPQYVLSVTHSRSYAPISPDFDPKN